MRCWAMAGDGQLAWARFILGQLQHRYDAIGGDNDNFLFCAA